MKVIGVGSEKMGSALATRIFQVGHNFYGRIPA